MYILFGLFLYFTFMKLLRVDMGPEKFYASNYMKTYAYDYSNIQKIDEQNYGIFKLIVIHLNSKGSLGNRITFIPSYKNYEFFIDGHKELFEHLVDKENA